MDDNLIGYLLNALDPETHRQTEKYLDRSPDARRRLEMLRRALEPLALDRESAKPPPDLVVRTLAHVAEYCCRDLPHAPPQPAPRVLILPRRSSSRVAVMVAASLLFLVGSLFFLGGGLGVSWVFNLQTLHGRTACEKDLQDIYVGLDAHRQIKGALPSVHKIAKPPRDVAGLVVPMLVSRGYLSKGFKVNCPGEGPVGLPVPFETALTMDLQQFNSQAPNFTPCYGYSLGYRDSNGIIHGPSTPAGETADSMLILMADTPPSESALGNSPNHGGFGQNVLFQDGATKFVKTRKAGIGGDDIYLNKRNRREAGMDWQDSVIGGGSSRP